MSKKRQSGNGWRLIPPEGDQQAEPVSLPPGEQRARIGTEKRSKGMVVTVVSELVLAPVDMKALAKKLKVACGVGGTAREDAVELQGDCRDKARTWLEKSGWGVR